MSLPGRRMFLRRWAHISAGRRMFLQRRTMGCFCLFGESRRRTRGLQARSRKAAGALGENLFVRVAPENERALRKRRKRTRKRRKHGCMPRSCRCVWGKLHHSKLASRPALMHFAFCPGAARRRHAAEQPVEHCAAFRLYTAASARHHHCALKPAIALSWPGISTTQSVPEICTISRGTVVWRPRHVVLARHGGMAASALHPRARR